MAESPKPPRLRMRRPRAALPPLYVARISVEGLFDRLNYPSIDIWDGNQKNSRVSVIFGDNGTGKTNILRLLYACLSPQTDAGLRTLIARTPFKNFKVYLSDGCSISITKKEPVGGYKVTIEKDNSPVIYDIQVDSEGAVREQSSVTELEHALATIGFDILFVDHNRVVQSTYSFLAELPASPREAAIRLSDVRYITYGSEFARFPDSRLRENDLQFPLPQVVDAVERWLRNEAFRQGATGEQNAAAVYLGIARALSRGRSRNLEESQVRGGNIVEILQNLRSTTESYIRHGLLSTYPFDDLINIYESSSKVRRTQIEIALTPFLDTVQRRVAALANIHEIVTVFESELNKYFKDKSANFHILDGLIISNSKSKMRLDALSSGEKQLVFLLSSAVVSRSTRSLIIIDEPELSLNYKWQRLIAGSLTNISAASSTQFILASHSIEIITRYVNSSVELVS